MPGRTDSPVLWLVGLFVAAVAPVGTSLLGWEFGAPSGPVAIGVACAVLAVVSYLR